MGRTKKRSPNQISGSAIEKKAGSVRRPGKKKGRNRKKRLRSESISSSEAIRPLVGDWWPDHIEVIVEAISRVRATASRMC